MLIRNLFINIRRFVEKYASLHQRYSCRMLLTMLVCNVIFICIKYMFYPHVGSGIDLVILASGSGPTSEMGKNGILACNSAP